MISKIALFSMAAATASSGFLPVMSQAPAYEVARCGPFFDNLGCPTNADGLGTVQYCSKWGFCSTSEDNQQQQEAGYYVSVDQSCNLNSDCTAVNGSHCDNIEGRCAIANVNASTFTPTYGSGDLVVNNSTDVSDSGSDGSDNGDDNSDGSQATDAPIEQPDDSQESGSSSLKVFGGLAAGVFAIAVTLF
jgi:hypothetical protein